MDITLASSSSTPMNVDGGGGPLAEIERMVLYAHYFVSVVTVANTAAATAATTQFGNVNGAEAFASILSWRWWWWCI